MGAVGSTIGGRYVLAGEIASGGMATVHLARQVGAAGFARIVAVKRLHERFARDPDFVAMFLDEARIVARIRHPNVVQTIDVVAEQNELFIVMEYVHGESLLRLLQVTSRNGASTPLPIAAGMIVGALHGLHEAHEARSETGEALGIVHRDVSPHNILVGIDGVARMLDFGVAKASERIQTTHEGQLKGKLSYMAPEQVTSSMLDRRTDIYAAAVVLWETLTGAKLLYGASEAAVVQQILSGKRPPPSSLNRDVPPALDEVALRGLAHDPAARFATAQEMALAIERSVMVASASEIGAWVRATCERWIEPRSQMIAMIEAKGSTQNLQNAVNSLRSISYPQLQAQRPPAPAAPVPAVPPTVPAGVVPEQTFPPPPGVPAFGSAPPARVITAPPHDTGSGTGKGVQLPAVGAPGSSRLALVLAAASFGMLAAAGIITAFLFVRKAPAAPLATATATTDAASMPSMPSSLAGASASAASASGSSSPTGSGIASVAAVPPTCLEGMVLVPGGRFFMGSDDDLPDEKPAHHVTVLAYCMDRHEVTAAQYRECSERGDCKRAGTTNKWDGITARDSKTFDPVCNIAAEDRGDHPVNCVDWAMADRYCKANGKRLPTEAEWEFAARGSDGRKYPWGDAPPSAKHLNACGPECVEWLEKHNTKSDGRLHGDDDGFANTAPVGSFPQGASRWGVVDIAGNVWEWVADYYGPYDGDDAVDPKGPVSGTARVVRGGAWNGAYADWVRPSFRFHFSAETRSHGVGFRCAK